MSGCCCCCHICSCCMVLQCHFDHSSVVVLFRGMPDNCPRAVVPAAGWGNACVAFMVASAHWRRTGAELARRVFLNEGACPLRAVMQVHTASQATCPAASTTDTIAITTYVGMPCGLAPLLPLSILLCRHPLFTFAAELCACLASPL